ncbi:MAG: 16S rRNA (guanine(527)-N(7))-methyltransferase RsmG, partial [Lachnospiraceae bacterium]|nr:16S rRNA (guanine(527)-N(7))-methyltransferase RsmG [Lachnospiraceae bacterium]
MKKAFENAGLQPDEEAAARFLLYNDLLVETNKSLNLTAITEFEDVIVKHFLDSCMVLADRREIFTAEADTNGVDGKARSVRLVDVGTGAGFPGLPIKIMEPSIRLTLIDSLRKRVDFLRETATALQLTDVECIHARAEEAGRDPVLRGQFDVAVSRAVAKLS